MAMFRNNKFLFVIIDNRLSFTTNGFDVPILQQSNVPEQTLARSSLFWDLENARSKLGSPKSDLLF